MIFREIRRFLRRRLLPTVIAGVVLAAGFSGAAVTLILMRALTRPSHAGLRAGSFATAAERTTAGGLSRIDWYTVETLKRTLVLPHTAIAAYARPSNYQLEWQQRSAQVNVAFTEAGFFSNFTSDLSAGHNFQPGWEAARGEGEALISADFSRRFFGSAGEALGQNIAIAGQRFTVIGVGPAGFGGLWTSTDVWTTPDEAERLGTAAFRHGPMVPNSWMRPSRWYLLVIGGIGTSPVPTLGEQLRQQELLPLHLQAVEGLTDDPVRARNVHASSQLTLVVALALLLSASLNYCLLLFARSALSADEFRLKRALGASPVRLAIDAASGPLFVILTSFLLSGLITVAAGHWLQMKEMNPIVASGLATNSALRILAVEFPLACLMGAAIALAPTLSLMRRSSAPLRAATVTHTASEQRFLNALVVVEIVICTLVCLFAGTYAAEYSRLAAVRLGYDPHQLAEYEAGIITKGGGTITLETSSGERSPIEEFVRLSLLGAQEQLAGAQAVAASSCAPFGPPMKTMDLRRFEAGGEALHAISLCNVSSGFFSTLGTRTEKGSGFTESDYRGEVNHAVINKALAEALWPREDAVDRTLLLSDAAANLEFEVRVVGVVDDIRQAGPLSTPQPVVYLPLTGNALALSYPVYFLMRGEPSPAEFGRIVQQVSQGTVKHLGIVRGYSIEEKVREAWHDENIRLSLSLFGALFIALIAYVGLYGVVVHSVSTRQKELALRLSFGASRWAIQRAVIERTLLCCGAAVILALLLWKTCFGFLDPRWVGEATWSWKAPLITSLICAIASVAISVVPSLKAARISPAKLLKSD